MCYSNGLRNVLSFVGSMLKKTPSLVAVARFPLGRAKGLSAPPPMYSQGRLEPDRPQHYRPAVCVNVQQYSSTTLVSLRFYPLRLKFGMHIKTVIISILFTVLTLR